MADVKKESTPTERRGRMCMGPCTDELSPVDDTEEAREHAAVLAALKIEPNSQRRDAPTMIHVRARGRSQRLWLCADCTDKALLAVGITLPK